MKSDREDVNDDSPDHPDEVDGEQKDSDKDEDAPASKRGERPGNLRRRSEWFEKRHGGG